MFAANEARVFNVRMELAFLRLRFGFMGINGGIWCESASRAVAVVDEGQASHPAVVVAGGTVMNASD